MLALQILIFSDSQAQASLDWRVTNNGIYKDGVAFFLKGQSWGKMSNFTYKKGPDAEQEVKQKLTELHEIGINVLRLYGSPDEDDWGEAYANYANLITWIEEWNAANPDNGSPNDAIYYLIQLSPKDPQSPIPSNLPEYSSESFSRAISDTSNPGSVASMVQYIDEVTGGSRFLLGYLIYHEFNYSQKYASWYHTIGARGIEDFMNSVADALHNTLAPGKLVSHTGDVRSISPDLYDEIENIDSDQGNVFAHFDLLGFNFYTNTDSLLSEDAEYKKIVQHRSISVNGSRGWFIGEHGASYDLNADPAKVQSASYTNPEGIANLQLFWRKCRELENMVGFMMFTVQDNDKGQADDFDSMKQRGHFDLYGDKKFLYFAYPDVVNDSPADHRVHSTDEHGLGVTIKAESGNYTINIEFENKTPFDKVFSWSIHGDDGGSSRQRFTKLIEQEYLSLPGGKSASVVNTIANISGDDLYVVTATVIENLAPPNAYLWGREHILSDAIGTVAGLDLLTADRH